MFWRNLTYERFVWFRIEIGFMVLHIFYVYVSSFSHILCLCVLILYVYVDDHILYFRATFVDAETFVDMDHVA